MFRRLLLLAVVPACLVGQVTITSAPTGANFTVAGQGCAPNTYKTPQTLGWTPGASCTVTFTSPQFPDNATEYTFANWQDGSSANPRTITAPSQATTYTANLNTRYFLTTVANPTQGGTVTGGGFYPVNGAATLVATPAAGYRFAGWLGPANLVTAGNTATQPVTVAHMVVQANFAPALPTVQTAFTLTEVFNGNFGGVALNNFGQAAANTTLASGSPTRGLLWTPFTANGTAGNVTDLGSLPVDGTPSVLIGGMNDQGQVVGVVSGLTTARGFLWQPSSPNAITGTMVSFLDPPAGSSLIVTGINNYGQIIGELTPPSGIRVGFIWTPNTPNGTTGTLFTDAQLDRPIAINDFGQVAINQPHPSTSSVRPFLFTPSSQHGTTGTYTALAGIDAGIGGITPNGTVLAGSLAGPYLWTPTAPNAATGSAPQIAIPPGFNTLSHDALNASGQMVGLANAPNASITGVLYSGGVLYDLTTLPNWPAAGRPVAINNRGQILVNNNTRVFLLTPQTSTLPMPLIATPESAGGAAGSLTINFYDPRGWQDLGVVNVLINNAIDGRNACYLAYSVPDSTLYLVNDAGKAEGPYAGSLKLGNSGTIENSQCAVALTSAAGSGNLFALTLNVTFKAAFGGNRILYTGARDAAQNNSGWLPLGIWQVPGAMQTTTTSIVGIRPEPGVGSGPEQFIFTFADNKGVEDLGVVNILINSALDGRHACYLAYARQINVMYLVNDAGDALLPGISMQAPGVLANNQCTVSWNVNAASTDGASQLLLTLRIAVNPSFGPRLIFYLAARDKNEANNTGWQASGTWVVQ